MRQFLPTRSDEPMYWLLFGAGGMVASMVLPAIMVVLIAAGYTSDDLNSGFLNLNQVHNIFSNWLLSLIVFGVVFLLSFYALHRMHHSSHDFGIHSKLTWYIAYGLAAAVSFVSLGLQLLMYVKYF
ncbi:MAG: fumarate reductase subunit FrdD [Succinivibrio sp.]|uniref:Fumarate reductase subunit D n=1 Tax=Succinivibrio faecicola TaxID=2820300 RepID=A0ABS7DED2_9GAMM|nr:MULTISPECIES: fumarate reductase subunit FrdD [Succinivibrio]MBW7569588.1 fumarate reductase subunit D [Succinivibrio faecicola]MCI6938906.1 fumarate reductase subunit D [Succinatimonas hippei]MDD6206284.1 fumarate reductase subunit D [Succinivibrio sp.]